MADVSKLKKQLVKADAATDAARDAMNDAIAEYASACSAAAVLREQVEHEEALEAVMELRGKKAE